MIESVQKIHATLWPVKGGWMWEVRYNKYIAGNSEKDPATYKEAVHKIEFYVSDMAERLEKVHELAEHPLKDTGEQQEE